MSAKQKKNLVRIVVALILFFTILLLPLSVWFESPTDIYVSFFLFLVPYLIAGYDVLYKAFRNIVRGKVLDEHFLMTIATIGAFALVLFPESEPHMAEGAAVMLFYQVGEWFQGYAVGKSRRSIAAIMQIAPDYANVMREGTLVQVDPNDVVVGSEIVIKPGERVPLDGVVVKGTSQLDTAALTGESVPLIAEEGAVIFSGCVNKSGVLTVKTTKPFGESTVSRILKLVEKARDRKARAENFITRFARYYTPIVVSLACAIVLLSPLLLGMSWASSVQSALIFLVVSCPCALVISVPLSFFGGIGAASKQGVLVKGSNYLEALAHAETVVFDKTGTLTEGTFNVVAIHSKADVDPDLVLSVAAHAEAYSDHPIAISVREAFTGEIDNEKVRDVREESGHGVRAIVDERVVIVGNEKMMMRNNIEWTACNLIGTILHVTLDKDYIGHIVIADVIKDDAPEALAQLRQQGIKRTVILTGDRTQVGEAVAEKLGIDECHAQLLPADKVNLVEKLLQQTSEKGTLVFVGDGINDAPVLMRADIGIAMGALGSDAAIEAADIVLMDDKISKIAAAQRIARKTMRIVWENIIFAIGVKVAIMVLALPFIGIATMWLAVFGDVGVAFLAILNAMRALRVS